MTGRSEHFVEGTLPHYRDSPSVRADTFPGIKVHPRGEIPHAVTVHHSLLGPNNDKHGEHWTGVGHEVIGPSTPINTGQAYVGVEHVQRYAGRRRPDAKTPIDFRDRDAHEEDQDDGSPRLLRHNGELWHVDGLHRTTAARALGRAFKARVYDADKHNASIGVEPHPGQSRYDVVNHVVEHHIYDNEAITSDHYDRNHGNYGPGEDYSMTTSDIHTYHDSLHAGGVADHRHP